MPRLTHLDLSAIRRLLSAGVRHAEIARRLNLAVGTISRIASDRKLRRRKLDLLADVDLPDDEDSAPPEYAASHLRRCPACGGMVYQWPCLTCRTRATAVTEGERERGREGEGEMPSWAQVSRPRPLSDLRSPVSARSETCAEHFGDATPVGPTGRPAPAQAEGLGDECETRGEPQRGDTTIRVDSSHPVPPFQGSDLVSSPPTQGCALG